MIYNIEFYTEYFKTPRKREELMKLWQCNSREVRKNISRLQKDINIVNMQDGRGWYIPDRALEILQYARQEYFRGLKSIAKAYRMHKRCNIDYQMELSQIFEDIEREVTL